MLVNGRAVVLFIGNAVALVNGPAVVLVIMTFWFTVVFVSINGNFVGQYRVVLCEELLCCYNIMG